MQGRNYATFLFFVCAIIGVYSSYPQNSDLAGHVGTNEFHKDRRDDDSNAEMIYINRDGGQLKRNVKPDRTTQLMRIYKNDRIVWLTQRAILADAARRREYQERVQQFRTIIDDYLRLNPDINAAFDRFERQYLPLAIQLLQYQNRQN